jgi:hypothetical protein
LYGKEADARKIAEGMGKGRFGRDGLRAARKEDLVLKGIKWGEVRD